MAFEVYLPKMSDHMETGTIIRWLYKEGDSIERGQVLLEIETDKAVGELEAPGSGILQGITYGEGDVVPVGVTLAYILNPGETLPDKKTSQREALTSLTGTPPAALSPQPLISSARDGAGQVQATPLARRLARELRVDLTSVTGSGPGGVITDEDVRAYNDQG